MCAHASCFVSITNILTLVPLGLDTTGSMGVHMEDLKVCVCVFTHARMCSQLVCTCAHVCECTTLHMPKVVTNSKNL